MKLHYHPLSPFSRKASVAVAMRNDPVELVSIKLGEGALDHPEFRAISPFGKIPVLETPEGPLIESTSIIEYLEERGPRVVLPPTEERIARHFDRLADLYLIAPVAALWWTPESDEGKSAEATARSAWALFESRLRGREFVAGGRFSLGDLGGAIATDYFERLGVAPTASIRAWRRRCFEVPAMAAALEAAMPFVRRTLGARERQPEA